jgi:outer membrane receptor protein involved in Fe transport
MRAGCASAASAVVPLASQSVVPHAWLQPRWRRRVAAALLGLFAITGAAVSAVGQSSEMSGRITGRIFSDEDGRGLPDASVMLFKMTSAQDSVGIQITGTLSRAPGGEYELPVKPGRYRLQVKDIAHKPGRSDIIEVGYGQVVTVDVKLRSAPVMVLPTVQVHGKAIRNTEEAVLAQEQRAEVVVDAVSAEQIKRTADSNVAEALKRVSGLSLVDDKYVFVRGMGERYSSTQINGATVGSPEPNKRVVPLDLIPANLLDNAWIVKTYSPELPAEFGGGGVNINTRDFPGHKTWSVAVTCGVDPGTTGGVFQTYDGGALDFLGLDDGTRDLPEFFQSVAGTKKVTPYSPVTHEGFKPDTLTRLGQDFSKVWVPTTRRTAPRLNFEGGYGNEFTVLDNPLGLLFGGVSKTSFDTRESINNTYRPGDQEGLLEPNTEYSVSTSTAKRMLSLLGSASYRRGESTTFHLRSLYNHIGEDEVRVYEGKNYSTTAYMHNTRLRWTERLLWTSNLGIEHRVSPLWNSRIQWRVDYSKAKLDEPDRREYNYELREDSTGGYWELSARGPSRGFTRMFGNLDENERGFHADWMIPLSTDTKVPSALTLGFGYTLKDREVAYRRLAFKRPNGRPIDFTLPPESLMTNENIGYNPGQDFVLTELTQPEDSYAASLKVTAAHVVVDVPVWRRLRASGGVRLEDWRQEVITKNRFASNPAEAIVGLALLEKADWMPAVNLTYQFRPSVNVRAAFSRTISRPDMRELSSFTMPDYDSGFEYRGSPDLKRASILNYDLRVEAYPGSGEKLSASVFYKDLTDPIELSLVSAGGALRKVPVNASWAWLRGLELEGRVELNRLAGLLADLAVVTNLTLTQSRARVPLTSFSAGDRQRERPLQGQAPLLFNLMLFYTPDGKPYGGSLTYNAHGRRLAELGLEKMPDAYESPYHAIDLAVDWRFRRYWLKFTASNLLDRRVMFTMDDYTSESWRDGRSFQLKIGMSGGG